MNGYVDILIFAVVAVLLLWRLRSVLGERDSNDPPFIQFRIETVPVDEFQKAAAMPAKEAMTAEKWRSILPDFALVETATVHHQLAPFFSADPQFRPEEFLEKSRKAFVLIVEAFAKGDKKFLEFMLSPALHTAFAAEIDRRHEQGEEYKKQIYAIRKSVISRASLDGTIATLAVDFVAEQSIQHTRADGSFVSGGDRPRETTHDRWIFKRDLKSPETVWKLVQTEDLDG
jgi:predicted lipid-binding transport protein (Tim44 family)